MAETLEPCLNPDCERLVSQVVLYCCTPCERAHKDGREIFDEQHTRICTMRHINRSRKAS